MTKALWFDMDGTIADLYSVQDWLKMLIAEDIAPYAQAKTMLNCSAFARMLNRLQRDGWKLGIISWTSKSGSEFYNMGVEIAKRAWLAKHLPSVEWDEIKIVRYGTNTRQVCGDGILFDDEQGNRDAWGEHSYEPCYIMEILKSLTR